MVGGVFWRPDANDPAVNSVTTGCARLPMRETRPDIRPDCS
jgi:hypothetical protein